MNGRQRLHHLSEDGFDRLFVQHRPAFKDLQQGPVTSFHHDVREAALHEEVVDLDAMLQVCYALEDGCLRLDSLFPLCVELLQVASRFGVSVTPKIHDLHS
eukprot:CAMPEP_0115576322 /NCGR_PEP_ID=MMETSP0272-20121206/2497_1 /TAXON_ID=71861 /ORGANISM="Scrippsiella trochoidea, Strain CCMP3099" /LENGTH=100 /DNA_ID=CAMNT_0003011099 /DNA_START=1060 /DNA_END=1362 /DNA_ORIENTATION=+